MGVAVPALDARMMPTAGGVQPHSGHVYARFTKPPACAVRPALAHTPALFQPRHGRQPQQPPPPPFFPKQKVRQNPGHPPPLTNQTIQSQSLSENQNQDHAHKQLGLLGIGPVAAGRGMVGEILVWPGAETSVASLLRVTPPHHGSVQ